jgi:hypothetical protein
MRDLILVFATALLASVFTYGIAERAASAQAHSASIVNDEEHGAVRVKVDGREVARFTAQGLHVRDDVKFGGVMVDAGPESFDAPEAR